MLGFCLHWHDVIFVLYRVRLDFYKLRNKFKVHRDMNLIGHVIKSCEAQMASRNIWLRTNQVHIMVNF